MRPARLYVAALALVLALPLAMPVAWAELKGRPRVLSGDTLRIGRDTVRLHGIDAPEQDQFCENEYGRTFECGIQALDALSELVGRRSVTCIGDQRDDEGKVIAVCYAGDMNLNSRMVRTGWAVARPKEQPDFVQLESLARNERIGIWVFKFMDPAEWRRKNPK